MVCRQQNLYIVFVAILVQAAVLMIFVATTYSGEGEGTNYITQLMDDNNKDNHLNWITSFTGNSTQNVNSQTFNWNALSRRMCPNMVPNSNFTTLLFELARAEINNRAGTIATCPKGGKDTMANLFYNYSWGVLGFLPGGLNTSSKKNDEKWVAYLPAWKCANDEIKRYMKSILMKEADNTYTN